MQINSKIDRKKALVLLLKSRFFNRLFALFTCLFRQLSLRKNCKVY